MFCVGSKSQPKPCNRIVNNQCNLRIHLKYELLLIRGLILNTIDLKLKNRQKSEKSEKSKISIMQHFQKQTFWCNVQLE